ncbi:MAG: hypothetical protein ORN49_10890, partial [Rhodobacteraceae bacterium]|nr:hypothetical protein [Paracoccaceae bacterium]
PSADVMQAVGSSAPVDAPAAPDRGKTVRKASTGSAKAAAPKPRPAKVALAAAVSQPLPRASGLAAAMGRTKEIVADVASEPLLLPTPRAGKADDLKRIKGVGPALEKLLNEVGVWHFDQIASWKARDIAFVDSRMQTFKGRITRDEWVRQARALTRDGGAA